MTVVPAVDVVTGEIVEDGPLSAQDARALTDEIRQTLRVGHDLIIRAYRGQAWSVLGYRDWDSYCAGEFAEARMIRLDREQRREIVVEMRKAGMSARSIGSAVGVSVPTVLADVKRSHEAGASLPDRITRSDGRPYPSSSAPRPDEAARRPISRKPLSSAFFKAATDLVKTVERLERLVADDRFPQNAEQVAAKHRSDLTRAAETLARVLDRLPT